MGFISEFIEIPTKITSLDDYLVKKIQCGTNYSAAITQSKKLMVTGELDGGKLGLGKAHISGYIFSFREVSGLNNVK
jgi:hypothetical protein